MTTVQKKPKPLELCLCPRCAAQFYNSAKHYIKRADPEQMVKDTCTYCSTGTGYDYLVYDNGFKK